MSGHVRVFCLVWAGIVLSSRNAVGVQLGLKKALSLMFQSSNELSGGPMGSFFDDLEDEDIMSEAVRRVLLHMSFEVREESSKTNKNIYRRLDGLWNNLRRPFWGGALSRQRRVLPNKYDDGLSIPRYRGVSGAVLPSARTVSLACFPPGKENDEYLDPDISQMFMQWGQYLDHDLILTELEGGSNCCEDLKADGTHPDMFRGGACFPILIEPGDRYFNTSCMKFLRSLGLKRKKILQQINAATAFIDGSAVYGTSEIHAKLLRLNYNGLLKTTEDNMLPLSNKYNCLKTSLPKCPFSGDSRVNVFPGLTGVHLIFHRHHNRMAKNLAAFNPHWDDEKLYQEARKINSALHQHITYSQYLPLLLGDEVMETFEMYEEYDYKVYENPTISNVFGAAAYRYGHSQINGELYNQRHHGKTISEIFFRPEYFCSGGETTLANGLLLQCMGRAQKVDQHFSEEVSDRLFLHVNAMGESSDLPARNVQRGRDHGLPPYVDFVNKVASFDLPPFYGIKPANIPCWKKARYPSPEDVDIFVGGMHETHVKGGRVGPTFAYLLGEQFHRLRNGDRFFYETQDETIGFTKEQLASIKTQSLSSVICHNTITKSIQPNAFATVNKNNTKIPCREYPDIDYSLWAEKVDIQYC